MYQIIFLFVVSTISSFAADKGMTWRAISEGDLVRASCNYSDGSKCNAYKGDTDCHASLPILCFHPLKLARPSAMKEENKYAAWSGGEVDLSNAVKGTSLKSLKTADKFCSDQFGPDWRMAEFHDGQGWGFWAQGSISYTEKFWVAISDQDANCWEQKTSRMFQQPRDVKSPSAKKSEQSPHRIKN